MSILFENLGERAANTIVDVEVVAEDRVRVVGPRVLPADDGVPSVEQGSARGRARAEALRRGGHGGDRGAERGALLADVLDLS